MKVHHAVHNSLEAQLWYVLICKLSLQSTQRWAGTNLHTRVRVYQAAPEEGEVLYEESVFYFDDTRKWRERYVVVRANYCLECHESVEVSLWKSCQQIKGIYISGPSYSFCVFFLQTFVKGAPPCHKLLPTGGKVLTAEEAYMAVVDKCFPDESCE